MCFAKHTEVNFLGKLSVCQALKICTMCSKTVHYPSLNDKEKHVCGYTRCKICNKMTPSSHLCYMQITKPKAGRERKDYLFIFFDLETRQDRDQEKRTQFYVHTPNLCVAQQVCCFCINDVDVSNDCATCGQREHVFRDNVIQKFIDYILSKSAYRQVIILSHYGSGFDNQFIFKHLVEVRGYRVKPTVILRGTKIITMNFMNLKFLDSFNYSAKVLWIS